MKNRKLSKILGVALTLALVFSLGVVFTAAPVAADPDEWSTYDLPDAGADGDWFREGATLGTSDIVAIGPIARDIDDYFWTSITLDADGSGTLTAGDTIEVLKSLDTEGRSWEATDFSADIPAAVDPVAIVAIVCSPEDADVVYVAAGDDTAANDAVYKTEDGGDAWEEVSDLSAALAGGGGANSEEVTCMAVGFIDSEAHVYVGTSDATPDDGEVYYINDIAFGGAWTDLNVQASAIAGIGAGVSQVYGIAVSPDFDDDAIVAALIVTDSAAIDNVWTTAGRDQTFIVINTGATAADWPDVELTDDGGGPEFATAGSDPVFVDDFDADDAYEFFVGVDGAFHLAGNTLGGIFRIYGDTNAEVAMLDDVDDDIISLDLAGDIGGTYLLAGAQGDNDVWYSDDDGDNWLLASDEGINPSGVTNTFVICDADIADTGIGWAATGVAEGAVSMTNDGGATWVGISLIDTNIDSVEGLALSPDFASPGLMFVLTDDVTTANDSLLRYDGTNWERIWESTTQYVAIDMVAVSPEIGSDDTVFVGSSTVQAGPGAETIYVSEDNGTSWAELREPPGSLLSLTIIDADTLIAGGDGDSDVYITDVQGRRAWDNYDTGVTADVISIAVNGDTVIVGGDAGNVFISEDLCETWDQVGAQVDATATNDTYVCFDSDFGNTNVIYAAADDTIARFLDIGELAEDWENFDADDPADNDGENEVETAIGIACVDGVLYVAGVQAMTVDEDGAVVRSVNPLEDLDTVGDSEWDHVNEGFTAGDNFDTLMVTEGSTILWTYDISTATIWTLTDVLAAIVTGVTVDPDVGSAIISWDGFDNATDYDVVVYGNEDMTLAYEWYDAAIGDDSPIVTVNDNVTTGVHALEALDAGAVYWVQVRAAAPINSKWSDVITFTTDPATMAIDADFFGPAIGATNVSISPSFGWNLIEEADSYVVEVSDTYDFSNILETATVTEPVYQLQTTLANSANYFWRVKAISGTSESNWATGTFTTAAAPVEAPAPPEPVAPQAPVQVIQETITPNFIYAIIGIGAALAILVVVLIVKTRKQ